MKNKAVYDLIEKLELQKHPEGGYYKRTYESSDSLMTEPPIQQKRFYSTAIYYLLESDDFSAWHRLQSDELCIFTQDHQ